MNRRKFLFSASSGVTATLAGCVDVFDAEDNENSGEEESENNTQELSVKYLGVKPRGFTVLGPHRTRRRI